MALEKRQLDLEFLQAALPGRDEEKLKKYLDKLVNEEDLTTCGELHAVLEQPHPFEALSLPVGVKGILLRYLNDQLAVRKEEELQDEEQLLTLSPVDLSRDLGGRNGLTSNGAPPGGFSVLDCVTKSELKKINDLLPPELVEKLKSTPAPSKEVFFFQVRQDVNLAAEIGENFSLFMTTKVYPSPNDVLTDLEEALKERGAENREVETSIEFEGNLRHSSRGDSSHDTDGMNTTSNSSVMPHLRPIDLRPGLARYYQNQFSSLSVMKAGGSVNFSDTYKLASLESAGDITPSASSTPGKKSTVRNVKDTIRFEEGVLDAELATSTEKKYDHRVLFVEGPAGTGKSSMGKYLAREQPVSEKRIVLFIPLPYLKVKAGAKIDRQLLVECALEHQPGADRGGKKLKEVLSELPGGLKRAERCLLTCRVLWILDGFDEISGGSSQQLVTDNLRDALEGVFKPCNSDVCLEGDIAVITSRPARKQFIELPPRFMGEGDNTWATVTMIKLQLWERSDCLEFIGKYFDALSGSKELAHLSEAERAKLIADTKQVALAGANVPALQSWNGVPLMFDIFCSMVASRLLGLKTAQHEKQQSLSWSERKEQLFQELSPDVLLWYALETLYDTEYDKDKLDRDSCGLADKDATRKRAIEIANKRDLATKDASVVAVLRILKRFEAANVDHTLTKTWMTLTGSMYEHPEMRIYLEGTFVFSHRSFAEYFIAESMFEALEDPVRAQKEIYVQEGENVSLDILAHMLMTRLKQSQKEGRVDLEESLQKRIALLGSIVLNAVLEPYHRYRAQEWLSSDGGEAFHPKVKNQKVCKKCGSGFTVIRRKHTCRCCGYHYCSACCPKSSVALVAGAPQRLCVACHSAVPETRALEVVVGDDWEDEPPSSTKTPFTSSALLDLAVQIHSTLETSSCLVEWNPESPFATTQQVPPTIGYFIHLVVPAAKAGDLTVLNALKQELTKEECAQNKSLMSQALIVANEVQRRARGSAALSIDRDRFLGKNQLVPPSEETSSLTVDSTANPTPTPIPDGKTAPCILILQQEPFCAEIRLEEAARIGAMDEVKIQLMKIQSMFSEVEGGAAKIAKVITLALEAALLNQRDEVATFLAQMFVDKDFLMHQQETATVFRLLLIHRLSTNDHLDTPNHNPFDFRLGDDYNMAYTSLYSGWFPTAEVNTESQNARAAFPSMAGNPPLFRDLLSIQALLGNDEMVQSLLKHYRKSSRPMSDLEESLPHVRSPDVASLFLLAFRKHASALAKMKSVRQLVLRLFKEDSQQRKRSRILGKVAVDLHLSSQRAAGRSLPFFEVLCHVLREQAESEIPFWLYSTIDPQPFLPLSDEAGNREKTDEQKKGYLIRACLEPWNPQLFEVLLANGFDPDELLWKALQGSELSVVMEKISMLPLFGADLNKQEDEYGDTPAHKAAYHNNPDVVRALHECGADLNKQNNTGRTPAYEAALYNYPDVIRALHECGADLNKQDKDGWTPAHKAAYHNNPDVVRALHECGADLNKQDKDGWTPAYWAERNNYPRVIRALHECRADL